ncbi:hypothetical protein HMPREF1546_00399 [Oscillibacter sp. KLE 1745]|nr:hypothetical protein HMPREF1546_00399 [Oscillibacter sp. KLE 1745]
MFFSESCLPTLLSSKELSMCQTERICRSRIQSRENRAEKKP